MIKLLPYLALVLAVAGCGPQSNSASFEGRGTTANKQKMPHTHSNHAPTHPMSADNLQFHPVPKWRPGQADDAMQANAEQMAVLDRWENRFAGERRTPDWARKMETELAAITPPDGVDYPQILGVDQECRSHTCRLDFEFAQNSNIDGWLNDYVMELGPRLPSIQAILRQSQDGQANLIVFASLDEFGAPSR